MNASHQKLGGETIGRWYCRYLRISRWGERCRMLQRDGQPICQLAEAAIVMLEMIFPKREECEAGAPPMFRRKVPGWGSARNPNLSLLCPRWEDRMSDPGRKLPRRIHVIRVSPRAGAAPRHRERVKNALGGLRQAGALITLGELLDVRTGASLPSSPGRRGSLPSSFS
jgi:hypothetical protein